MARKKKVLKCPKTFEKYQKYKWEARPGIIATGAIIDIDGVFIHVLRTLNGKEDIITFQPDSLKDKLNRDIITWVQDED